ncbi:MAG: nitrous oxide reductase accessory protein NosL [Ignavibacteria bacterium]|nr:nitrous oxide reductase accessory protein NosL [Ignavibacteria bacterium]
MNAIIILFSLLAVFGCSKETEPIEYGKDQCAHCRMTIVDNKFGAEMVTSKGKVYKFDAAECLVNFLNTGKVPESEAETLLVTNLESPGNFIDARSAAFLISPKLRSPMGENISAFSGRNAAEKFKEQYTGETYDWNSLVAMFRSR